MSEQWVTAVVASGMLEAEILQGLLEAAGLHVWLSQESAATAMGLGIGPLAEVEVRVPAGELEEARRVLDEYYRGDLDDEEEAPAPDSG